MRKKGILMMVTMMLIFTMCACGGKTKDTKEEAVQKEDTTKEVETEIQVVAPSGEYEINFVSCKFENELTPRDKENARISYGKIRDDVYIDLVLEVKNHSENVISSSAFLGAYSYAGEECEMSFMKEDGSGTRFMDDKDIQPKEHTFVHLTGRVDEYAMDDGIVVRYTILGEEKTCEVEALKKEEPLTSKIEVKVGDKVNVNDLYTFEVKSCSVGSTISAYNTSNAQEHTIAGNQIVEVVLEVKNHYGSEINEICTYMLADSYYMSGASVMEEHGDIDIEANRVSLKAGEKGTVHLYVPVSRTDYEDPLLVRFNLGVMCFYCEVEK